MIKQIVRRCQYCKQKQERTYKNRKVTCFDCRMNLMKIAYKKRKEIRALKAKPVGLKKLSTVLA